ncbi:MAG: TetR/AcrR family transcriptional regulator [Hyphomonadaceae bacterium]|nr:TetR/AcrR family transcriptional regulator [Hyphomonadaceae bacterium]
MAEALGAPRAATRNGRGRPRAEEVTERVNHIISVAEALIVRDGYQAVSVDAIARAAGISKKTIYSQFENKAGLLAAVVDRLARSLSVALAPVQQSSLREGLLHQAEIILDASYDETTLKFDIILFREARAFPELRQIFERAAREQFFKPVEEFLLACAARGLLQRIDCVFAAQAFVHLLTGDIVAQTAMGTAPKPMSPAERRAHAERVCDLFIGGIEKRA